MNRGELEFLVVISGIANRVINILLAMIIVTFVLSGLDNSRLGTAIIFASAIFSLCTNLTNLILAMGLSKVPKDHVARSTRPRSAPKHNPPSVRTASTKPKKKEYLDPTTGEFYSN